MIATLAILLLITVQRLAELGVAGRNTRRLLARGAVESGADHYLLIVVLHTAWLAGLWLLAWGHPVVVFWLAIYLVIQALRIWVIASLGERWTTRIITLPGESLVRRGPYRFLSHPNYLVVAAEIAVAPLMFGLPLYALVFFLLNAGVLFIRIRAEQAALDRAAPTQAELQP
ncbi:MAG: Isoprenylcysteine carboxyl methyltransferase [Caulobacteraceae bacterium]|nr:Isoprenylcysteine carboxyl methyltransferase [Caulobacteraceae bacterium]